MFLRKCTVRMPHPPRTLADRTFDVAGATLGIFSFLLCRPSPFECFVLVRIIGLRPRKDELVSLGDMQALQMGKS